MKAHEDRLLPGSPSRLGSVLHDNARLAETLLLLSSLVKPC